MHIIKFNYNYFSPEISPKSSNEFFNFYWVTTRNKSPIKVQGLILVYNKDANNYKLGRLKVRFGQRWKGREN